MTPHFPIPNQALEVLLLLGGYLLVFIVFPDITILGKLPTETSLWGAKLQEQYGCSEGSDLQNGLAF